MTIIQIMNFAATSLRTQIDILITMTENGISNKWDIYFSVTSFIDAAQNNQKIKNNHPQLFIMINIMLKTIIDKIFLY